MINCRSCSNHYDVHNIQPRVAPCGHTYCLHCLAEVLGSHGQMICQDCGTFFEVVNLKDFPPNIDLMNILQKFNGFFKSLSNEGSEIKLKGSGKKRISRTMEAMDQGGEKNIEEIERDLITKFSQFSFKEQQAHSMSDSRESDERENKSKWDNFMASVKRGEKTKTCQNHNCNFICEEEETFCSRNCVQKSIRRIEECASEDSQEELAQRGTKMSLIRGTKSNIKDNFKGTKPRTNAATSIKKPRGGGFLEEDSMMENQQFESRRRLFFGSSSKKKHMERDESRSPKKEQSAFNNGFFSSRRCDLKQPSFSFFQGLKTKSKLFDKCYSTVVKENFSNSRSRSVSPFNGYFEADLEECANGRCKESVSKRHYDSTGNYFCSDICKNRYERTKQSFSAMR